MSYGGKHQHSFKATSTNHPYYCGGCDQLGFGSSYTCSESDCNVFHHVQCVDRTNGPVTYPFSISSKCALVFVDRINGPGQKSLCVACGNKIKGYHYRCKCTFRKHNMHPSCLLSYEPTLVAAHGLTLQLKSRATAKCLCCLKKKVSSKVDGWAYVSTCGSYCYHVSCVMNIIHETRAQGNITEKCDPFQTIRERFPADKNRLAASEQASPSGKKSKAALNLITSMITGIRLWS
uniref:uncharacterized protein LOC122586903 n=1 Tax=Erigeron canadensis TaxID=72917 RepID=UPI001CB90D1A|nr:uncharacterized protein LOC122586903 [Erigeron canadensis]